MCPRATDAAPRRIPVVRRGLWWAADYVYAARRQLAVLGLPWAIGRPRPVPPAWSRGDTALPEVVLLPGVYEHWTFLKPLGDAIAEAGYRVHVVHGLGMNRRSISATAERLRTLLASSPPPAGGRLIVAHSKGGLIGKHLLVSAQLGALTDAAAGGAASVTDATGVRGLVAVATPFGGSRLASLFLVPSIRAFRPADATIIGLGRERAVNAHIVSIFGPYDPHIPEGSALEGAVNVEVPMPGHFRVLGSPATHRAVVDALAELTQR